MNIEAEDIFKAVNNLIIHMSRDEFQGSNILNAKEIEEYAEKLLLFNTKKATSLEHKLFSAYKKYSKETTRIMDMYNLDKSYSHKTLLAGVDEVGRGPLAGPIVAAAVILPSLPSNLLMYINDSKKLSEKTRKRLSEIIRNYAVDFTISEISNEIIDSKGIAWCNNEVFLLCFQGLKEKPEVLLSDGYPVRNLPVRNEFLIKGDEKSASIACASIIAKHYRDTLMKEYSVIYPEYGFERNAGYGTKEHIEAIKKHGPCPIHRNSFIKNFYTKE